jgi:hypothetical protein
MFNPALYFSSDISLCSEERGENTHNCVATVQFERVSKCIHPLGREFISAISNPPAEQKQQEKISCAFLTSYYHQHILQGCGKMANWKLAARMWQLPQVDTGTRKTPLNPHDKI